MIEHTNLPLDTEDALRELGKFQSMEIPSTSDEHYAKAFAGLYTSAKLIAAAGVYAESGAVLCWLYLIDDCIVLDIRARKPHALLLLAYYAVLLATLERSFWYIEGWSRPLVEQIEVLFAGKPRFLDLLRWPKKHVSRR